mgnify:CR=1 FL=1
MEVNPCAVSEAEVASAMPLTPIGGIRTNDKLKLTIIPMMVGKMFNSGLP